jgi:hypothetical protein
MRLTNSLQPQIPLSLFTLRSSSQALYFHTCSKYNYSAYSRIYVLLVGNEYTTTPDPHWYLDAPLTSPHWPFEWRKPRARNLVTVVGCHCGVMERERSPTSCAMQIWFKCENIFKRISETDACLWTYYSGATKQRVGPRLGRSGNSAPFERITQNVRPKGRNYHSVVARVKLGEWYNIWLTCIASNSSKFHDYLSVQVKVRTSKLREWGFGLLELYVQTKSRRM